MQSHYGLESAIKEIRESSDRAAAIVAAAFVEDYLTGALKAVAQENDELFDATLYRELKTIATIRNRFAHRRAANSFEAGLIRDQTNNLVAGETIQLTLTALGKGDIRSSVICRPVKPEMSPRDRFIETCYMFLRIFAALQIGLSPISPTVGLQTKGSAANTHGHETKTNLSPW